jgi:hypothetical protein
MASFSPSEKWIALAVRDADELETAERIIASALADQLRTLTVMARESGLHEAADWILEQCVEGEPGAEEGLRRLIRYETDNALKAMNLHL